MPACPSCRTQLGKALTKTGVVYGCRNCHGVLAGLPVLRKNAVSRAVVNQAWFAVRDGKGTPGKVCPHCMHAMSEVAVDARGTPLLLDLCASCHVVWFDTGEFEQMPKGGAAPTGAAPVKEPPLSPKARGIIAVEKIKRHKKAEALSPRPDRVWKYIPGLMGFPVEMDPDDVSPWPAITVTALVACIAVFAMTLTNLGGWVTKWGFYPCDMFANGGLNLLFAFFLHGGWLHIIGNMYFLLVFGNNVEDDLGRNKFVTLLLAAHVAGFMLHAAFSKRPEVPLIGASAGISGVIAYYGVAFPRARIGFLFLYFWWIRLPALAAIILYAIVQLIGVHYQLQGASSVSYLAHLGGLAVGLIAGLVARHHKKHWNAHEEVDELGRGDITS
jgi:membrane associated rhomboid family serine protease